MPVFRTPDTAMSRKPAALAVTAVKNASKQAESSRSRSTSVMPPVHAAEPAPEPEPQENGNADEDEALDEKLYCICKTQYDEDKVMIACDRLVSPCIPVL